MADTVTAAALHGRTDAHNASVNDRLARAGYCGMTHLCTGRVCVRLARHPGTCRFVPLAEALGGLARDEPAPGQADSSGAAKDPPGEPRAA